MTKNRVHIDEAALNRAIQPAVENYQRQVNATLQETIREVRDELTGHDVDEIHATLVSRLHERIPALTLDEAKIRQIAAEIADGTLTD